MLDHYKWFESPRVAKSFSARKLNAITFAETSSPPVQTINFLTVISGVVQAAFERQSQLVGDF
jgi:hypothetical protein